MTLVSFSDFDYFLVWSLGWFFCDYVCQRVNDRLFESYTFNVVSG